MGTAMMRTVICVPVVFVFLWAVLLLLVLLVWDFLELDHFGGIFR